MNKHEKSVPHKQSLVLVILFDWQVNCVKRSKHHRNKCFSRNVETRWRNKDPQDVWQSTLWQFTTMSVCASTHLGSGCGFNKPAKGEEFVDFLVWTEPQQKAVAQLCDTESLLKHRWEASWFLFTNEWWIDSGSALGVGFFFGCKAPQISWVKHLENIVSHFLVFKAGLIILLGKEKLHNKLTDTQPRNIFFQTKIANSCLLTHPIEQL